jgi:hypothetical protein
MIARKANIVIAGGMDNLWSIHRRVYAKLSYGKNTKRGWTGG